MGAPWHSWGTTIFGVSNRCIGPGVELCGASKTGNILGFNVMGKMSKPGFIR